MRNLSSLRASFPITERAIYMDHAAVAPISTNVQAAMQRPAEIQAQDIVGSRVEMSATYTALRQAIARLVGSTPSRIAFLQNTSHGLSLLANGQAWQPGDNIVVPALEFPSNYLIWHRLEAQGIELRRLDVPDGRVTPDILASAVDRNTRIVAVSAVQYYNGFRCDLAGLAEIARSQDALLVVDGTQAVGAVMVDMAQQPIDGLVVSAHKWMLGPLGIGFMALSDRMLDRTEVTQLGWLSVKEPFEFRRELDLLDTAARFEPGTENAAGLFGLRARLEEIEAFGAMEIESRIFSLANRLSEQLGRIGCRITSPWDHGARSGILTFRHDNLDPAETVKSLRDEKIFVSARHGSVRLSPHYYNSEDEVDSVAAQISSLLKDN